ncbi:intracellular growth attenuator family protein [Escherichia coli]|nr:intracellular growth attenuator family protein [Escherichia coli]
MLLFWIPLDMPLKFTLSWMKGAQTIEATSVKQLADAGVRVGDTLRISGTGMCNIRTSGTGARKPTHLFYRLTARRSSGMTPAHCHYQNLNWSTKRRH